MDGWMDDRLLLLNHLARSFEAECLMCVLRSYRDIYIYIYIYNCEDGVLVTLTRTLCLMGLSAFEAVMDLMTTFSIKPLCLLIRMGCEHGAYYQ